MHHVRRELRTKRNSRRGALLPSNHHSPRRSTDDPQLNFNARAVHRKTGKRAQRGLQCCRRTAEYSRSWQVQFRDHLSQQLALCPAGEDERRGAFERRDLSDQSQASLSRVFSARFRRICDHDCVRPGGGVQRVRRDHSRAEAFEGRRLHEVERLALRDAGVGIDQADFADAVPLGKSLREGAADRAAPDERNEGHEAVFYRDDSRSRSQPCFLQPRGFRLDAEAEPMRAALVTGGSRGIGFAIAEALTASGASVAITGRDIRALESARQKLGGQTVALRADVQNEHEAAKAVDDTAERFGGLDVLVNNAGVGLFAPVADTTPAQWRQVIDTNLSGVFYCCHAAIPHMRRRGGGWIINISSLASKNALVNGAAYCASKCGLNAFSEALMQEVRHDNIRVSYVMPGSVSTGFGGRGAQGAADWKLAPEDVARAVMDLIAHPARSLPSRVELRPSRPPK